jgi:hypothetical protein
MGKRINDYDVAGWRHYQSKDQDLSQKGGGNIEVDTMVESRILLVARGRLSGYIESPIASAKRVREPMFDSSVHTSPSGVDSSSSTSVSKSSTSS